MVWNDWMHSLAWNPWQGFEPFDTVLRNGARFARTSDAPVRVYARDDALWILVELPGRDPSDVELSVRGRELVLRAKAHAQRDDAQRMSAARRGFELGEIERTFTLPWNAAADAVKATFENGILSIELTRAAEDRPRRIEIHNG